MDYAIDSDYDYLDLGETGLIRTEVGAASLEKNLRLPILFRWSLPVSIVGVITNGLVLWIWLSIKTKFKDTVYLFRALALADFFYVLTFPLATFYRYQNTHNRVFVAIFCYSHRTISLHITLMLAIVRFIKIYYPLHVQKMLSHSRVRLGTIIIVFCNLLLYGIIFCRRFYLPEKDWPVFLLASRRITSLIVPVVAQNVLMTMVVFKLRRFSKTVTPLRDEQVLYLPEKGQTMTKQEDQVQGAHKSEISPALQTGHLLSFDHRGTACYAGPQDSLPPVAREETVQSDPTAEGQLKTKQRSVDCEAEAKTIQEDDPLPKTEPQRIKKRYSEQGLKSGPWNDRMIAIQPMSASNKLLTDIDSGIIYVVLAICASTFVSQLLCSIVYMLYKEPYGFAILKTVHLSYTCTVLILINHSINLVFYLFISSFRQALLSKCSRVVDRVNPISSVSVKATYPAMSLERTALDSSNMEMQSPITSEVQLSSSKYDASSAKYMPFGLRQ